MKCTLSPINTNQSFGTLWLQNGGREAIEADLGKRAFDFESRLDELDGVDVFISRDKIATKDNDLSNLHYLNKEKPTAKYMGHIIGNFDNQRYYVPSEVWSKTSIKKYGEKPAQIAYAVVERVAQELSSGKGSLQNFIKLFR